jgi:hypothetical protein
VFQKSFFVRGISTSLTSGWPEALDLLPLRHADAHAVAGRRG